MPKSSGRSTIYALGLIFLKNLKGPTLHAYNFFVEPEGYRYG